MSVSPSVYVGPYVTGHLKYSEKSRTVRSCKNKSCARHGGHASAKFCAECGTKIGKVTEKYKGLDDLFSLVVAGDLVDMSGERFPEDVFYLAPDYPEAEGGHQHFFNNYEDVEIHRDLSELDPSAEIKWFERKYAKVLKTLRKKCSEVQVCWGIHQWWE